MREKRFSLSRLFYNNKFALVFSLLIAIVLWVLTVSTDTESYPHAITKVPVTITLSDAAQADGLKVFSPTDSTATVYIKGNSLVVNQITSSDLQVVAPLASTITAPGTYSFTLSAQKKGDLSDYSAVSVSPNQAIITVDRYKEKTFTIQSDISYKQGYKSDSSYFVGTPTLSSDTVTVSGPEKQVQQVNKVAFEYEVSDTLTETKNFTAKLVMYDANGNQITENGLTLNPDKVEVSLPVLPRAVLPLSTVFSNKPAGLALSSLNIQVSPQTVEVAGPADVLSDLSKIELAPIDFSTISTADNTFKLDVSLPSACKNLSNLPTATVTMDLSGFTARTISVTNFNVKNLSSDKTATVYTKNLSVTVVGPESEVSKLTGSNIVGQIDMAGKENLSGHTEMPVTFSISNTESSWVYGSYMANISIN